LKPSPEAAWARRTCDILISFLEGLEFVIDKALAIDNCLTPNRTHETCIGVNGDSARQQ
jgi:hypothetical protein